MFTSSDIAARALTEDGAFRVLTALTTQTVRGAARAQSVRGELARTLGELMTGAILVREAMSPDRRVQVLLKDSQARTRLVADAHPTGWNRGIVNPGMTETMDIGDRATLEVLYTLPNDVLQQGIVALPRGADISAGLMTYMQESEQIVSMLSVCTIMDESAEAGILAAGGYMVQLMPDAPPESLQRMIARLEAFQELDQVLRSADASAESIRRAVLGDIAAAPMNATYLCFGCNCDRGRVLAGLGTLADSDIREMLDAGKTLDIRCDACGKQYFVTTDDLGRIMAMRHGTPEPEQGVQN